MEESITPGQNGLPPRKSENDRYTPDDKSLLVAAAAKLGTRIVADAYGLDWHHIASWKRFYGKESEFNTVSKNKKNKAATAKSKSTNSTVSAKSESTATKINVSVAPVAPATPSMPVAQLIIQSPSGQEITPEDVRAKINSAVGAVDKVYIRADEGKAYWVRGEGENEEHGAVELW